MAIKKMTHANNTATPDEIIVDYALRDGLGNQIHTTYAKSSDLATVATSGSYNDLSNKPTIPSAPGTLDTTATTAQSTAASEALSGGVTLHKISKTGTYSDLLSAPAYDASTDTLNVANNIRSGNIKLATKLSTLEVASITVGGGGPVTIKNNVMGSAIQLNNSGETNAIDIKTTSGTIALQVGANQHITSNGTITNDNDIVNKGYLDGKLGTVQTDLTTAQTPSASESVSSAIKLHKVSKTGTYSDLIGTPTISTTPTTGTGLWDANTIINYIASRGQQLMTNGTFLLGNNYNFTTGTFDGADANGGGGSVVKAGASTSFKSDEFMPIVKGKLYRLTYDLKPNYDFTTSGPNPSGINGFLPYLDQYDVDKNMIVDSNTNYKAGTLVQLTQDLTTGSSVMYLSDVTNWTTFASVNATVQIWDYQNSFGYQYGPGEYTRHTHNAGTSSTTDLVNSRIVMQNPYMGPTVPAGTYVSQNRGGGYAYIGSYDKPAPNVWSSWTHDTSSTTIRGGCAYAKIGWLWDYNVTTSQALVWDTVTAYSEGWAVKNNNKYYIAKKAVPAGTLVTNEEYWYTNNNNAMPVYTKITNIQFTVKSLT